MCECERCDKSVYTQSVETLREEKGLFKRIIRGNRRVGSLVSVKTDDGFTIGFSLCRKEDKFDKLRSFDIAYNRAIIGTNVDIPKSIRNEVYEFVNRCERYYKN